MSILDRYLIRQIIPPFLLALGLFTFALAILPTLESTRLLLAKGVPLAKVGLLLILLLPSALSLTIPMALLTGVLMALGRLSGDRESVALVACGVSPLRVLRPLLVVGVLVGGIDLYVLVRAVPDANQLWQQITFQHLTEHTAAEIRPRVFFERFPNKVLYIRDTQADGTWSGVLLADTSKPGRPPVITLAESGRLVIDKTAKSVRLELTNKSQYIPGDAGGRLYAYGDSQSASMDVDAASVFGSAQIMPGIREKTYSQLRAGIEDKRRNGIPPHQEIMQIQQMFSFPVACLVFVIVGLALGLNTRKEGRLAGLTLGLAVILSYWAVMALAEAWVKGIARTGEPVEIQALWARWIPNIVVALIALVALWRQTRPNGLNLPFGLPAWLERRRSSDAASPAAHAPVVLVRMPRMSLPWPRLLDRYVGGQFLRAVTLAFLGLLALYYVGAFVDLSDKLFKGRADLGLFAEFLIQSTPQFITFVIPLSVLVAALGTIGALTRTGELVVMRACGVSLYRAAVPLLVFAAMGSVLLFMLEDRVLGAANRQAVVLHDRLRGRDPNTLTVSHNWLVADDGRIYYYEGFEPAGRRMGSRPTLHRLSVFETTSAPSYRLREHLYTPQAVFEGGTWRVESGTVQRYDAGGVVQEEFGARTLALAREEDFRRSQVDEATMTWRELREYSDRLGRSGYNNAEERVDLHRRLAFPMATIVMALLAIPFGVTIGRKGALYGIGLATVIAAAYFLAVTVLVAIGEAGLLHPALAAWGANILFATGALFLTLTVRT